MEQVRNPPYPISVYIHMTEGVYELVTQLNRRLSEAREAISKQEVEITCLKNLVESAFLAGRRGQSWEDFKNENNLQ